MKHGWKGFVGAHRPARRDLPGVCGEAEEAAACAGLYLQFR